MGLFRSVAILKSFGCWVVLGASAAIAGRASATVLTFDLGPQGVDGAALTGALQRYGDRANGSPTPTPDSFVYLIGAGWTPNVVVDYGPGLHLAFSADQGNPAKQFGDLHRAVIRDDVGGVLAAVLKITLTADPGFVVNLLSFDIAALVGQNITIGSVAVTDEHNKDLYRLNAPTFHGGTLAQPLHQPFAFDALSGPLVQGKQLNIILDLICSGPPATDRVAIDNISFTQAPAPGATALAVVAFGVLGAGGRRRRV